MITSKRSKPAQRVSACFALAAGLAAALAGCGGSSGARLQLTPGPANLVIQGIANVEPNAPESIGSITVCISAPGKARITSVEPDHPVGHITVEGFAVRPSPWMAGGRGQGLGDEHRSLTQVGFGHNDIVTQVCDNNGSASELGLQLSKPTRADVASGGWIVNYSIAGNTGHFVVPIVTKLCDGDASQPACARLDRYFVKS